MSQTFTFDSLPQSLDELKAMPEAGLTDPLAAAALVICVLMNYENDTEATCGMLDYLKGPKPLNPFEKQFLRDRLKGKMYVVRSFFEGTSPSNDYTPGLPYTITVSEGPYAYAEEGYAKLDIRSSGADSVRQIKMRKKGEQWFLWENYALSDIRIPASSDDWT
ncbi:MAG: hypothetical protein J5685_07595 [Clostridiales bacterium]|nr:hypothetical protein [Clostridiales bacterium]